MISQCLQPSSLEALKLALVQSDRPLFAAGGTDLVVRMNRQSMTQSTLIDLSHMDPLKVIERRGDKLFIGAMCTMQTLSKSALVQSEAKLLSTAADHVGSTQIRNRATIGGNVANAAQCADTVPALIALEAEIELMDSKGLYRTLKVDDFVLGIGRTRLEENEAITGFYLPAARLRSAGGYAKIGSREKVTIAKLNGAMSCIQKDGHIGQVRVALGSLGARAFYAEALSEKLENLPVSQLLSEEVLQWFVEEVDRAIPGRASQPYKRNAVKAVAFSMLEQTIFESGR
ncbi:FAD binding domain-containing protein [Acidaminobacter hydrogenoformans]|uniref:Carbon-monoxide dehydrogenase medium subunit n=1 Tax=Acidaminobacter hydrogenoformans DSM 2784 TaxID=1120920 RepID=A0A1G5S0Z5_9FIRM|nr:FAD binding domain-containing protein [Acidaminobacter hydrogenoformans]SCZ79590.1 carbon-monoxide dehydrogenase medium subunit [Acidaminobacter hydrogenoformans DSM 2784]